MASHNKSLLDMPSAILCLVLSFIPRPQCIRRLCRANKNIHAKIADGGALFQAAWLYEQFGYDGIYMAWEAGYNVVVERLIRSYGVDPNHRVHQDESRRVALLHRGAHSPCAYLLHRAVNRSDVDLVRFLVQWPAIDINAVNDDGQTALFCTRSPQILRIILSHPNIIVNHIDERGYSALHWAIESGDEASVVVLLSDRRVNAYKGTEDRPPPDSDFVPETPLEIARRTKHPIIIKLLKRHTGRRD